MSAVILIRYRPEHINGMLTSASKILRVVWMGPLTCVCIMSLSDDLAGDDHAAGTLAGTHVCTHSLSLVNISKCRCLCLTLTILVARCKTLFLGHRAQQ